MPKKQKSGLYRSKVTIGADPNGKPVYKYISGRTRRELEDARQEVIAHYITKTALSEDMLFGVYFGKYFDVYRRPHLRPSTLASYRPIINKSILPAFAERRLRAITALDLQAFMNTLVKRSKTTVNVARSMLQGVFAQAFADHIIPNNPALALRPPEITPPEEKRVLTPEERLTVLSVIERNADALPLAILYYTGMRQGEMRGLQWGDIDFSANTIHIQRDVDDCSHCSLGDPKTHAANRIIPLFAPLRELLFPLRGLPNVFVVQGPRPGRPLGKTALYTLWTRLMLECGFATLSPNALKLPKDERESMPLRLRYQSDITPHCLRHNFITMCWEAGFDALITQRIVGHSRYSTTADIYTHLSKSALAARLDCEYDKMVNFLPPAPQSVFSSTWQYAQAVSSPSPSPESWSYWRGLLTSWAKDTPSASNDT